MDAQIKKNRLVVKVGTSTLTYDNGNLNLTRIEKLVRVLSDLANSGREIVLVTSGAIAVGVSKLKLSERPKQLRMKQAAAGVGQCELMHIYDKFFMEYGHITGQILLTSDDVLVKSRHDNLVSTFDALLELGVIPIVNANDSVSFDEIESGDSKVMGDNDSLSATVCEICSAGMLIILSDIDGLYDSDPHKNPNARLMNNVDEITPEIIASAGGAGSQRGTGGMITKLQAAARMMERGVEAVIINGDCPDGIYKVLAGEKIGTRFVRKES